MLTLPVSAQQIMEGEAEVKNLSVTRSGSRVDVKMDIDVSSLNVGSFSPSAFQDLKWDTALFANASQKSRGLLINSTWSHSAPLP